MVKSKQEVFAEQFGIEIPNKKAPQTTEEKTYSQKRSHSRGFARLANKEDCQDMILRFAGRLDELEKDENG